MTLLRFVWLAGLVAFGWIGYRSWSDWKQSEDHRIWLREHLLEESKRGLDLSCWDWTRLRNSK